MYFPVKTTKITPQVYSSETDEITHYTVVPNKETSENWWKKTDEVGYFRNYESWLIVYFLK